MTMETQYKYSAEDEGTTCPHCKRGKIEAHGGYESGIIRWCSECGGNSPEAPPSVNVTFDD